MRVLNRVAAAAVLGSGVATWAQGPEPGPSRVCTHCTTQPPMGSGDGCFQSSPWPSGIVPYLFDANVNLTNQSLAREAMDRIEAVSSVQFVPRTTEPAYITIQSDSHNYSTWVGYAGFPYAVGIFGWEDTFGTVIHEFMHALGAWHEQSRTDRNSYIEVLTGNIPGGYQSQFNIMPGSRTSGPYDFDSVMHYWNRTHALGARKSILVIRPFTRAWQYNIGQVTHISNGDKWLLHDLYSGGSIPPRSFELLTPADGAAVGNSNIDLSWKSAESATSYDVVVDEDPTFGSPTTLATLTGTSYTISSLAANTLYYWKILARNANGTAAPMPLPAMRFFTGSPSGPVIYVDSNASPAGDGSSWTDALNDLQVALALAEGPNSVTEIRVGQGTYTPDQGTGNRDMAFWLVPGVELKGGYGGVAAGNPNQRDPAAFPTILSGDLAGNDPPGGGSNAENSYHVLVAAQLDGGTVLDGCIVAGGNAEIGSNLGWWGAGLYIDRASPTVVNTTFTANQAVDRGSAVNTDELSEPVFINCTIAGNISTGMNPAALYAGDAGDATLSSCRILSNEGDGVYGTYAGLTLVNCLVAGNTLNGVALAAGALAASNCTVVANAARGVSVVSFGGTFTVANSIVWGNASGQVLALGVTVGASYSCIQGGFSGTGNISADPRFVLPASGNYRLRPTSPCIDAANNSAVPADITTDLAGLPRFVEDLMTTNTGSGSSPIVDMGSYEFQCYANCDGSGPPALSVNDYTCFMNRYAAGDPWADCDGSGTLSVSDYTCFMNAYAAGCL